MFQVWTCKVLVNGPQMFLINPLKYYYFTTYVQYFDLNISSKLCHPPLSWNLLIYIISLKVSSLCCEFWECVGLPVVCFWFCCHLLILKYREKEIKGIFTSWLFIKIENGSYVFITVFNSVCLFVLVM